MRRQALHLLLAVIASLCPTARSQDLPAVTNPDPPQGFLMPDLLSGGLRVTLSASQNVRFGYYGSGAIAVTALTGNAGYQSVSERRPFSLLYSGGFLFTAGQSTQNYIPAVSTFQNLTLTQAFNSRLWNLVFSDSVRYLPESPVNNFSGIFGAGTIGLPVIGPFPGQSILTRYGQRVMNTADVSLGRQLTGSTTLHVGGSSSLERFVDNSGGLDYDQYSGTAGVTHRINALTSAGGTYTYSQFTYPTVNVSFTTQTAQANYSRQWTRKISTALAGGPLITRSSVFGARHSSISFGGNADLAYTGEVSSAAIMYSRGVRSGSGVVAGTVSDDVSAHYMRKLSRLSSVNSLVSYTRNNSLAVLNTTPFSISTVVASVQGTRAFARYFSAYADYNIQKQLTNGFNTTSSNAFNGLSQLVGVGITYSPNLIHLGHK